MLKFLGDMIIYFLFPQFISSDLFGVTADGLRCSYIFYFAIDTF